MSVKICLSCKSSNPPFEEYCLSCGSSLATVAVSDATTAMNDVTNEATDNIGIFDIRFTGWLTPKIVKFLYFLQVVVLPIIGVAALITVHAKANSFHLDMCKTLFANAEPLSFGTPLYPTKTACISAAPGVGSLMLQLGLGAFAWLVFTIFTRLICEAALLFFRIEAHLKHLRNAT